MGVSPSECYQFQARMSAAVMESGQQPPHAGSNKEIEKEIGENQDQLGDLVETMESVKLSENLDPEKIIKHPLQNAWTLWFFKNDKTRSWEENPVHRGRLGDVLEDDAAASLGLVLHQLH